MAPMLENKKPLQHCTESLKRDDIETFSLPIALEHKFAEFCLPNVRVTQGQDTEFHIINGETFLTVQNII